jgi:hypothetical protein
MTRSDNARDIQRCPLIESWSPSWQFRYNGDEVMMLAKNVGHHNEKMKLEENVGHNNEKMKLVNNSHFEAEEAPLLH